ncbi:MAG: 16S rRNA processing protein RimM, partial [Ruminiclostridium sp.]|nr:16S rRNA processing protein RimM [Ruminiclostridium sp.]
MRKQYLEIGKIVATQGLKGEFRVQYYCDSAEVICDFDRL